MEWEIFGRITEASEEADVDEVPGEVCSVRMVVPCAIHALHIRSAHLEQR